MIKAVIFDFYGVLNKEMSLNDPLLEYIRLNLKDRYKLGIISNAIDDFMYKIADKKMFTELFDDIVISYQVGVNKPNPAIYKISLDNLKVKPEEAVFIDNIESYCQAARNVGMQAITYENFEQTTSDLELLLAVADN